MFEHEHSDTDFKYLVNFFIFSYGERIINLDMKINLILMSFQYKHNCQGVINYARGLNMTISPHVKHLGPIIG
jgi:hypothetical protein